MALQSNLLPFLNQKGHDHRASFKLKAFGKQVAVDVRLNK